MAAQTGPEQKHCRRQGAALLCSLALCQAHQWSRCGVCECDEASALQVPCNEAWCEAAVAQLHTHQLLLKHLIVPAHHTTARSRKAGMAQETQHVSYNLLGGKRDTSAASYVSEGLNSCCISASPNKHGTARSIQANSQYPATWRPSIHSICIHTQDRLHLLLASPHSLLAAQQLQQLLPARRDTLHKRSSTRHCQLVAVRAAYIPAQQVHCQQVPFICRLWAGSSFQTCRVAAARRCWQWCCPAAGIMAGCPQQLQQGRARDTAVGPCWDHSIPEQLQRGCNTCSVSCTGAACCCGGGGCGGW